MSAHSSETRTAARAAASDLGGSVKLSVHQVDASRCCTFVAAYNNPAVKASVSIGRHNNRPSQVCVNAFTSSPPLGEGRRKTLVDILHGAARSTLLAYGEKRLKVQG